MLKALFLDMDETLCDTPGANEQAKRLMAESLVAKYGDQFDGKAFADAYVTGIYREWTAEQHARYMPIIEQQSEEAFRVQLIHDLLVERGINERCDETAQALQDKFDQDRIDAFDFYPGIKEWLAEARQIFTLVVITNGPEFSQIPKVERVNMEAHVDHLIIGGQEPEEKPFPSIFRKALQLANCEAHEVIHVGDSLASDIAGANNSGITSVWIQHQRPLDAELGINPSHMIMHPDEIPALVEKLHRG
ncbi:2-haloalkanoic acid dehalogenase [gamma proteobacterium IMCC2047]|nr:2-haloalkanoic acid dehalogenase [gamma proteobacterium IMCC2047]